MASDSELVAVCNFLNELSLAEIIQYDPGAMALETESTSSESSLDDVESVVTSITSDEDIDSENDDPQSTKRKRKLKSEAERVRQRVYDKKCRSKKKTINQTYREAFVAALNELIQLMYYRLVRTENETNILALAKKNGLAVSLGNAVQQLALNQGAINCINSCASTWEMNRNGDSGKFFLRGLAKEIQGLLDILLKLEKQLNIATAELQWRVEGKTTGVWV